MRTRTLFITITTTTTTVVHRSSCLLLLLFDHTVAAVKRVRLKGWCGCQVVGQKEKAKGEGAMLSCCMTEEI